jgi:GNAT superfamily N-acetyltransferase
MEIQKAQKFHLPEILKMIQELAEYEKAKDEVTISLSDLERDGFGSNPLFEVILAIENDKILGMAFYYFSYSTWKGKCIYLEDIIVKSEFRGKGIGSILFEEMINIAKSSDAKRMQWQVLDWNQEAIKFYKKYNADIDASWLNGRFNEAEIKAFQF